MSSTFGSLWKAKLSLCLGGGAFNNMKVLPSSLKSMEIQEAIQWVGTRNEKWAAGLYVCSMNQESPTLCTKQQQQKYL